MKLRKLAEKMADYNRRLETGQASKIKPDHVERVLDKLRRKAADLESEIASTEDPERKARLIGKLGIAGEHIERAEWLLREIE